MRISDWSSYVCSSDLAAALLLGLPRGGSGRRSLLGPPRRAASPASPSCSISFRPSGCTPPLARASPVVLAAHPRLGGAMGFLGSAGGTDGFHLPTAIFRWTVRILRRDRGEIGRAHV